MTKASFFFEAVAFRVAAIRSSAKAPDAALSAPDLGVHAFFLVVGKAYFLGRARESYVTRLLLVLGLLIPNYS